MCWDLELQLSNIFQTKEQCLNWEPQQGYNIKLHTMTLCALVTGEGKRNPLHNTLDLFVSRRGLCRSSSTPHLLFLTNFLFRKVQCEDINVSCFHTVLNQWCFFNISVMTDSTIISVWATKVKWANNKRSTSSVITDSNWAIAWLLSYITTR